MSQSKQKILVHLPNPLHPIDTGSKRRIVGFLKYFNSRKETFVIDIVANNYFREPRWTAEQRDFLQDYCDRLFVYEGEQNIFDFVYAKTKSIYYQKLLKRQLPIDSDYFTPPGYCRFVHTLLSANNYDIFWLNYVDYAHLMTDFKGVLPRLVIDMHDIACEIRLARKNVNHLQGLAFDYSTNFQKEIALLNKFDTILVNSQTEMEMISPQISSNKLHLIPHLVQDSNVPDTIPTYPSRQFDYDLLFVGTAYQPNIDGLNFFLTSIFPKILYHHPDIRFAIVGSVGKAIELDKSFEKNVLCLGFVPDLAEVYLKTRVVLCPLREGSGTKVKLQEAMAYALPIVSTTVGASGLALHNGLNSFITDDPDLYAQKVLYLLERPDVAEAISTEVALTFENQYSNHAIFAKLDQLFEPQF